ncbi:hypothetical protein Ate02nite_67320 [Paractinoplanes tereljensis]|uniref:Uncharacterized protein n=2 Tax=Paractinoplanes tereljensis TaxID=571912 RepID=A0A919NUI3_9ACTN|nr:hypothetical protein Ate02nite_67320 [Actinoplanes tereljensis]
MAFMARLLVDEYGFLFGGEEGFPVDVTEHDWESPYPTFVVPARFEWEAGGLGAEPNIFRHPEIRDWVCDDVAWSVLSKVAPSDPRLLGKGYLGEKELHIVQVVTMLDVVDVAASVVADYGSYRVIEFPAFRDGCDDEMRSRIFRIPGLYTDIFLGDLLKSSLDEAGIVGLGYSPVPVAG